jgi:hypothetical protein
LQAQVLWRTNPLSRTPIVHVLACCPVARLLSPMPAWHYTASPTRHVLVQHNMSLDFSALFSRVVVRQPSSLIAQCNVSPIQECTCRPAAPTLKCDAAAYLLLARTRVVLWVGSHACCMNLVSCSASAVPARACDRRVESPMHAVWVCVLRHTCCTYVRACDHIRLSCSYVELHMPLQVWRALKGLAQNPSHCLRV